MLCRGARLLRQEVFRRRLLVLLNVVQVRCVVRKVVFQMFQMILATALLLGRPQPYLKKGGAI